MLDNVRKYDRKTSNDSSQNVLKKKRNKSALIAWQRQGEPEHGLWPRMSISVFIGIRALNWNSHLHCHK